MPKPDPIELLRAHEVRCTHRWNWVMAMLGALALCVLAGWMHFDNKITSQYEAINEKLFYLVDNAPGNTTDG